MLRDDTLTKEGILLLTDTEIEFDFQIWIEFTKFPNTA